MEIDAFSLGFGTSQDLVHKPQINKPSLRKSWVFSAEIEFRFLLITQFFFR